MEKETVTPLSILWAAFWSLIFFIFLMFIALLTFPIIGAGMIFSGDVFTMPIDNFHSMTRYQFTTPE
jgi:hypothetical protein